MGDYLSDSNFDHVEANPLVLADTEHTEEKLELEENQPSDNVEADLDPEVSEALSGFYAQFTIPVTEKSKSDSELDLLDMNHVPIQTHNDANKKKKSKNHGRRDKKSKSRR